MAMEPKLTRRGRPPKSDGPDTRQRLLSAALELFAEKGFAATSVREIAESVGIRDSAIYAHFESKQALLDALMQRAGPGVLGNVGFDAGTLAALPPQQAMPQLFGRIVAQWSEPEVRKFTAMLLRDGADKVGGALDAVIERLTPLFAAWQQAGHFPARFEPAWLAWQAIMPLATIRLTLMGHMAAPDALARARHLAQHHIEHFLAVHLTQGDQA